MLDIHCHVLPGVDDGPATMEEAVALCKVLATAGITGVIATPHYIEGSSYMASPECIEDRVKLLNGTLEGEGVELTVYPGNELYIDPELPSRLASKHVLTLNHTRYVLVELPSAEIPMYTEEVLYQLQVEGYIPIIAHAERYGELRRNLDILERWIERGAFVQVNTGSFKGRFGRSVKGFVKKLLKLGMVHFVATDSHGMGKRLGDFEEAKKWMDKILGVEETVRILRENPYKLLRNEEIDP